MSHTEVPTDVVLLAYEVVRKIRDTVDDSDSADPLTGVVTVPFDEVEFEHIQPLVKWLEYIIVAWAAEFDVRMEAAIR